jgi:catechol 2,3-dioxygenase-like lactoylglutathione lyase family enzyme
MPITDRSTKEPLIKAIRIGHGTLEVDDLQKSRKFYEEVLGLEVHQVSMMSMVARGGGQVYAVVASGNKNRQEMSIFNHNGIDVGSREEVDRIHALLTEKQEELGIRKIRPISSMHGDYSFYFSDLDGNWWEILVPTIPGGYAAGFDDPIWDLTGLHEFDGEKSLVHTHDPKNHERLKNARQKLEQIETAE